MLSKRDLVAALLGGGFTPDEVKGKSIDELREMFASIDDGSDETLPLGDVDEPEDDPSESEAESENSSDEPEDDPSEKMTYLIAKGRSLSTKAGIKVGGQEIELKHVGSQDSFDTLILKGYIVKK